MNYEMEHMFNYREVYIMQEYGNKSSVGCIKHGIYNLLLYISVFDVVSK